MEDTGHRNIAKARGSRQSQPGRHARLRLACRRCQRRKIKCDGEIPSCRNCRNVGADCADGESARSKDLPRAYVSSLRRRIYWLESIIQTRCPDIDLHSGPAEGNADAEATDENTILPLPSITEPDPDTTFPPTSPDSQPVSAPVPPTNERSHEIGLVALGTNQEPRYIGPSSGYVLARVMLAKTLQHRSDMSLAKREAEVPTELVDSLYGELPLPGKDVARRLSDAYFETTHYQYPVLHRPTFQHMLEQEYGNVGIDPVTEFQVLMVLAIGANNLSRGAAHLPGESYCLSALKRFHEINIENSLKGLQCLVLLLIFATCSSSIKLNAWYLNYHCIAALLDLGLQRDITTRAGISLLEQEIRTRIFWVVYMLDRNIATIIGRPIGLRDEACELRLPQGLDDSSLHQRHEITPNNGCTPMAYSIHLFRLAKLNSEIKYVANSVARAPPPYAYPANLDMNGWQNDMLRQLKDWKANMPTITDTRSMQYMQLECKLRYHSIRLLLLRPSPAIPRPSPEALRQCYHSSVRCLLLFDQMYREDLLAYSWMTFHGLVIGVLTMLYCIKAAPDIARSVDADSVMEHLSIGLSILSATGEHWTGARKCRDILRDLGRSTVRQLSDARTRPSERRGRGSAAAYADGRVGNSSEDDETAVMGDVRATEQDAFDPTLDDLFANTAMDDFFGASESVNIDNIVQSLFQDLIPAYMPGET